MPRYFSVEQANRALPLIRRIVEDIVAGHERLERVVEVYRSIEGGAPAEVARRKELNEEIQELTAAVNSCIGELHELGVLFKGFDEGLVDFYSMLGGRAVFLCWKLGEPRVEWWHEIEAGYAGRTRLPERLLSGPPDVSGGMSSGGGNGRDRTDS